MRTRRRDPASGILGGMLRTPPIRPILLLSILLLQPTGAGAGGPGAASHPAPVKLDPSGPADPSSLSGLSGRDIYARVLDNRFDSFMQRAALRSGDRGGNQQETRLEMWFQSLRDEQGNPREGTTLSKSVVRYTHPYEIRHSGYLVIQQLGRVNDQFVYRRSTRRIKRVNLRQEAVFGTDFSFEDIVPREIEDAEYERHPDTTWEGRPMLVIAAYPKPEVLSEYSRFESYIDPGHFVPLRTRYWDDRGIEVKVLRSDPEHVERHGDVWVPMKSTMRHLLLDTFTSLEILEVLPNVEIGRSVFDMRRLESNSH